MKLSAYQQKTHLQTPLTTKNKFEILTQLKPKEGEKGKSNNNSFESFVQLHSDRIKEICGNQPHSKKDGWQTVRNRKSRTRFRQKSDVRGGRTTKKQSFDYQSNHVEKLEPNPSSKSKKNSYQME